MRKFLERNFMRRFKMDDLDFIFRHGLRGLHGLMKEQSEKL